MKENYKNVAKKLGVKYRIWKYGFEFLPKDPDGKIYKLFQILPLDGWTWDEHKIVEAIANDPVLGLRKEISGK